MTECRQGVNKKRCNCTYDPCAKKGICCECLIYHLGMEELPACCFPDSVERSWDRSFRKFVEIHKDLLG